MSQMQWLLDLKGKVWLANPETTGEVESLDALRGPAIVISDYHGAPFGVESLPAHHHNLAPLLDKRLRDEGDIDGLARVIIHARERQGDLARVCYTAVPLAVSMRYRRWVGQYDDHLLFVSLLEALLILARRLELDNGVLAFVSDDSVDVLVLQDGLALHASRQRLYGSDSGDQTRIAAFIAAQQSLFADREGKMDCLLLERSAGEGQSLIEALASSGLDNVRAVVSAARLFEHLRVKHSDLDGTSRTLYLANRALPWVAAGMLALCLSSVVGGLYWKQEAHTLRASLSDVQVQSVHATVAEMEGALRGVESLALPQRERADFVHLAERVRTTPDPANLIRHLRQTIPAGIELTEVGIVSDEAGVLIIVAGRSASVAAPFAAEERFVKALNGLGYEVVRREITSGLGNSLFRLALTWSET